MRPNSQFPVDLVTFNEEILNGKLFLHSVTLYHKATWSKVHVTLWVEASHNSHYSGKFGSHRHCSCDDMFLVIKRQDSTCFYSNLPLIFFSIAHDMKVCGMLCSVLVTRIKSNDKWSNRENFSRLIQKYRREGNRKKKTRSCWRLTRLHFELSSLIL